MTRVFVKPGDGRRVPLPGGKIVPEQGVGVELTEFVQRRLACGDLVLAEAAAPIAAAVVVVPVPEAPAPAAPDPVAVPVPAPDAAVAEQAAGQKED